MPESLAITGAAGYVAPRHVKVIRDTGNRLIAVTYPHDSVGDRRAERSSQSGVACN